MEPLGLRKAKAKTSDQVCPYFTLRPYFAATFLRVSPWRDKTSTLEGDECRYILTSDCELTNPRPTPVPPTPYPNRILSPAACATIGSVC